MSDLRDLRLALSTRGCCKYTPIYIQLDFSLIWSIHVRDTVLLRSGPRKKTLPYVAKISALWDDPKTGEGGGITGPRVDTGAGGRDQWTRLFTCVCVCVYQESWWWVCSGTTGPSTRREAEIQAHTVRWGSILMLRHNWGECDVEMCTINKGKTNFSVQY